jgi:hypothetical protein
VETKELTEALAALDPTERDALIAPMITAEALGKAIEAPEGIRRLQSPFDKYATRAMETYKLNHPPAGKASEALEKKLDKLERAHAAAAAAADLRFEIYKTCMASGVPFDLVSDSKDIATARAKIDLFRESKAETETKTRNELLAGAHKPGSGNGHDAPRDPHSAWIAGLPAADRAALEDAKRH